MKGIIEKIKANKKAVIKWTIIVLGTAAAAALGVNLLRKDSTDDLIEGGEMTLLEDVGPEE